MNRVMKIAVNALNGFKHTNCEEWIAVLDASDTDRDMLHQARALAIHRISATLRPSSEVRLGKHYKIKEWFRNGLQSLVQRGTYFSDEEEEELGFKTTCKLYRMREDYRRSSMNSGNKKSRGNWATQRVMDNIERVFQDELEKMEG